MISLVLSCALSAQPELSFADGVFTIKEGDSTVTVPLSVAALPLDIKADKLSMHVSGTYITFDQRGLGIQYADKGGFTSLGYMPTTPKLFTKEQILQNAELIDSGERTAKVSAVSGYEIVGETVYMLMRWDDKRGVPWLETLVSIDASGEAPKVNLIGRFIGYTSARGPVRDELYSAGERLFAVTRSESGFGVGDYSTTDKKIGYRIIPGVIDRIALFGKHFLSESKTAYGTTIVGLFDPATLSHRTVLETRGELMPSHLQSAIRVKENGVSYYQSLSTGALFEVSSGWSYAETKAGVLAWSPASAPTQAKLIEPNGWIVIATWASNSGD